AAARSTPHGTWAREKLDGPAWIAAASGRSSASRRSARTAAQCCEKRSVIRRSICSSETAGPCCAAARRRSRSRQPRAAPSEGGGASGDSVLADSFGSSGTLIASPYAAGRRASSRRAWSVRPESLQESVRRLGVPFREQAGGGEDVVGVDD